MKRTFVLIIFLLFLSGCQEITTTTVVVEDADTNSDTQTAGIFTSSFDLTQVENEPLYTKLWHLQTDTLDSSISDNVTTGADINISGAWSENQKYGEDVVIAVVDDDMDKNHEDVKNSLFAVYRDEEGDIDHGTECVGVIGARQDGVGTVGVAPKAKMVFVGFNLYGTCSETVDALQKAADLGADVISNSWGSYHVDDCVVGGEYIVIDKINELAASGRNGKGIVIVFANGNDTYNLDNSYYYDESEISTVIGVGATGPDMNLSTYSNYGSNIDVVAPGGDYVDDNKNLGLIGIVAPTPTDLYAQVLGTSFSAPIVAGVAGLVLSTNSALTAADVRTIINQSATKIYVDYNGSAVDYNASGHNLFYAHGKVNAGAAVELAKTWTPGTN